MAQQRTRQQLILFTIGSIALLAVAILFVLVGSLIVQQMPKIQASPKNAADLLPARSTPNGSYANQVDLLPVASESGPSGASSAASANQTSTGSLSLPGRSDTLSDKAISAQTKSPGLSSVK